MIARLLMVIIRVSRSRGVCPRLARVVLRLTFLMRLVGRFDRLNRLVLV